MARLSQASNLADWLLGASRVFLGILSDGSLTVLDSELEGTLSVKRCVRTAFIGVGQGGFCAGPRASRRRFGIFQEGRS